MIKNADNKKLYNCFICDSYFNINEALINDEGIICPYCLVVITSEIKDEMDSKK